MGRELGAVIACVQEIEIACVELEKQEGARGISALGEIRELVRRFFAEPSVESALEVQNRIQELQAGARDDESDETIMERAVQVDRIQTTLKALSLELGEVLEDLG